MGVQIDLPLNAAERAALLTHCDSTVASYFPAAGNGQGGQGGMKGARGGVEVPGSEERAIGRSHGELLYQYQQQQYQLHQERISEAQMQQAYYSLSVAPQDTYCSQVGGSFEDLGCSASQSLCVPDETMVPAVVAPSSSSRTEKNERDRERERERDRERETVRAREAASPSTLQQQQMQLLELHLLQKRHKQRQGQAGGGGGQGKPFIKE